MTYNRITVLSYITGVTGLVGLFLLGRNQLLWEKVESMASKHFLIAWLLILSLFVFRSIIPFLPSVTFYFLCGRLFVGRFLPFLVSLSGITLLHSLSYWIGAVKKENSRGKSNRNFAFFHCLFKIKDNLYQMTADIIVNGKFKSLVVLALSPFPDKMLGRICGSKHMNFTKYLLAAFIGSLPSVISITLLGKGLSDPSSPLFLLSLFMTVTVTVVSFILFRKSKLKEL